MSLLSECFFLDTLEACNICILDKESEFKKKAGNSENIAAPAFLI